MLSSTLTYQPAKKCWSVRFNRRTRAKSLLTLFIALSATAVPTISLSAPAAATPAYPPRANCAVSIDIVAGSAGMTVTGTGFGGKQPVSLSLKSYVLRAAVANAVGTFRVYESIPADLPGNQVLHAAGAGCAVDTQLPTTETDSARPSEPPIVAIERASALNGSALPSEIFVGIIALVIVLGLLLFFIASRTGRRHVY
jgi:hypothetical protein